MKVVVLQLIFSFQRHIKDSIKKKKIMEMILEELQNFLEFDR